MGVMGKTVIGAVCVLLLCGGLFCAYLAAQIGMLENIRPAEEPISLLDLKIEELNERELLELKVTSHRKRAASVASLAALGAPDGSAIRLAEVHADLIAAEIELYRYTSDRDKLLAALKARVDALTDKIGRAHV